MDAGGLVAVRSLWLLGRWGVALLAHVLGLPPGSDILWRSCCWSSVGGRGAADGQGSRSGELISSKEKWEMASCKWFFFFQFCDVASFVSVTIKIYASIHCNISCIQQLLEL